MKETKPQQKEENRKLKQQIIINDLFSSVIFLGWESLTNITFPDCVTSIG